MSRTDPYSSPLFIFWASDQAQPHLLMTQDGAWQWSDQPQAADAVICGIDQLKYYNEQASQAMLIIFESQEPTDWPDLADAILTPQVSTAQFTLLKRQVFHWRESSRLRIQLEASEQRVEALEIGSKALGELHDEGLIFQRLVEIVAKELHSDRVSILRVFPDQGELQMIAAHGIPPEIVAQARPKIGEGIAGRCAALGEPIFVTNHQNYRDSEGGQVSGEEALKGGRELPMSLTTPILVKGEVLGVVNVTSRVGECPYSAEEIAFLSALMSHAGYLMESARLIDQLSELQAFSEQVINTLNDPLVVVTSQGKVLKTNPRFIQEFGEVSSLKGLLEPHIEAEMMNHLASSLPNSFPNIQRGLCTFDAQLTPFEESSDQALILFQDITERQQMGKQLVSAEKMASLGILAAGVAHEINNPLGFVKTNTKEAGRYFEDLFEVIKAWKDAVKEPTCHTLPQQVEEQIGLEEVREDIPNLIRESLEGLDRIQKITSSLKSFAHPDTENTREAQLSVLIDNALVITQSKWKHTLHMEKEISEHGPLSCIPSQLEQVFMNLIVNAAQAAKSKEITATMKISVTELADHSWVEIRFQDQCGGIPQEVVERIFDPFFTTKDIGEGTGLGLHIAHNIIEGHSGYIKVESQPPVGTAFVISLPLGVKKGPMVIKQLSRFKI